MSTFILNQESANSPVQDLLSQAAKESVAVLDAHGNVIAYVLPPEVREALIYAEADLELTKNRERINLARQRRGGITTNELLERAKEAAEKYPRS
jgi:hypothetical protein